MFQLRVSAVHGVGVFTTERIPKGARLRLFDPEDWRFVRKPRAAERALVEHYCVPDEDGWHCPADFTRMSVGWYLNDSEDPNLRPAGRTFVALRSIAANEELLIDYDAL